MVNQATGFTTQARFPENDPFFTDTGMTMKCFGVNGDGGLELNYGNNVLALLVKYDFHTLQYNVQSRYVLDLINGKQYDLETRPSIPAWTAWVWVPIKDQNEEYDTMTERKR